MPSLAGRDVGEIGYGMMGLTLIPNRCSEDQAFETLRESLACGCNFWNAAEFYGPYEHNSLVLLERYFKKYPEDASRVVLSIKGGGTDPFVGKWDSSASNVRRSIDACIKQLGERSHIAAVGMFGIARHDGVSPWEETLETLQKEYVATGKIRGVFLSEVNAGSIHKAVSITKILAVEVELSLMTTDVLKNGIAEACARYGIPLIAYSPMGRGLLTGGLKTFADIPAALKDYPQFSEENFPINLELSNEVSRLAAEKKCTPAQLAVNWVRCLNKMPGMPTIIPIPGGITADRVRENSQIIDISHYEMAKINDILAKFKVVGRRYPDYIPINT